MANESLSKELILKIWDSAAGTYNTVARLTGYSFEVNKETIDITNFDSNSWKEFLVNLIDWSVSDDGVVVRTAISGKETYEDMMVSILGTDTTLVIQMINPLAYTDATDGTLYSHEIGNVFLTAMTDTGSVGDKQTYSMALSGSGTLTHVSGKFNTGAEALTAAQDATFPLGEYTNGSGDEILEGDVVVLIDNIGIATPGYYSRSSDTSPSTFGEAWTAYTI